MLDWFPVVVVILGGFGLLTYFTTKKKDMAVGILGIALILGILNATGVMTISGTGTADNGTQQPTIQTCQPKVISSLAIKVREEGSNSWEAADGTIKFYNPNDDPSSPTASPIATITLTNGSASDTSGVLQSCTKYRVVIDGGSTYYDKDLGIITLPAPDTTTSTVTVVYHIPSDFGTTSGMSLVGSFSDLIDEASMASTDGATNTLSNDANELVNDTTDSLTYDLSAGDGQFKVRLTIACNGANKVCKDAVLGFQWDDTAPPEGDEVSSITAQLHTGTDLGIPSSLLNYWSKEDAVKLGTLEGGTSATYDLTFTVSESNITAGDDQFYLYVDDLGDWHGKDTMLGTKATGDRTIFKNQA